MLFMELAIGQYTGRGPIGALGQICPLFKGKYSIPYIQYWNHSKGCINKNLLWECGNEFEFTPTANINFSY